MTYPFKPPIMQTTQQNWLFLRNYFHEATFSVCLSPITLQWLKSDLKPETHSPDGNSRTSEQITSETGKGHWFSIARKTSDNCICQAEITRTLILHFIRKPDEERRHTTDVRRTRTQRGDSRECKFPLQDCG